MGHRGSQHPQQIPIPPTLLDKPFLQSVTLPPTATRYGSTSQRHGAAPSSTSARLTDHGYVAGAREEAWLRDTVPMGKGSNVTSNSKTGR
jgi:hypothetical protein